MGEIQATLPGSQKPLERAAGSLTFKGSVCYLSLGLQGPGLLSGGPSAGLSFPSLFYSLAMLYDSASSEPHKSSLRKETAGERQRKGSETEGGGGSKKEVIGPSRGPALSSCEILPFPRQA
ncbi:hypothetical protein PBY51_004529 [Eleginops maclovinus]|uniref:Uncharacterized protein n=1 Tax=Eleginops maclovinus TaxID=56733 RepID=A0AAN8AWE0_ELEMC|nr:hypothetical protein PBY51_004529 [Eleginops maclovinus]